MGFNGVSCYLLYPPMKIDKSKVIKKQPRLLCEYCFKENCKGHWLYKIINFTKLFL
jgi:hypothetical protein